MRLLELFDNPLEYRRMQSRAIQNSEGKGYTYGFRVEDFWYKVWLEVYPISHHDDDDNDGEMPWEFYLAKSHGKYIMSIDFAQYEYGEKAVPYRKGPVPGGVGSSKEGREGTGNELQVFGTVIAIAKEVYSIHKDIIGVIEYGAKQEDPARKRLYGAMMRKFGITGKTVELPNLYDAQDRVYIILNSDK